MAKISDNELFTSHKKFSTVFFNATWDLLDKSSRTKVEKEKMIHLAHASLCHWIARDDCTEQNLSIGYWLLSRVYAVCGEAEDAIKYAKICLEHSEHENVEKVYLGYAHEAMARAARLSGETDKCKDFILMAKKISLLLGEEDREQLEGELKSI